MPSSAPVTNCPRLERAFGIVLNNVNMKREGYSDYEYYHYGYGEEEGSS